jgi:ABC-type lipoprotein export system ATPase subunit
VPAARQPAGKIGWVPQQPALYSKLSVAENLRLFARLERLDDPEEAVGRMLGQTGLEHRADDEVGRLSGGNQQRVNIAIGLLGVPTGALANLTTESASKVPDVVRTHPHIHYRSYFASGRSGPLPDVRGFLASRH